MLSSAIRWPLKAIPKSAKLPILMGPNRGLKWIVGAGTHGCWLGRYESYCTHQFASHLRPGMVVYDVGAHAGYYALMIGRRVGPNGYGIAFEASRNNAANLRRHLHINRINNIEVVEAAVCERHGYALFEENNYNGQFSEAGRKTPTVRLDDYPTPNLIKMDIEGAELLALQGAKRIISEAKTTWFVATHGDEIREKCIELFSRTYRISFLSRDELWAYPN